MGNRRATFNTRKREWVGPKIGVTQAEYDRLKQINDQVYRNNMVQIGTSPHQARIIQDRNTGEVYLSTPPDPMGQYYVIFEPTITRKVVEQQTPANPGIRLVAASTYGTVVPVSIGRRVVTGNIIDAEPITPRLEGAYEYTVTERIPRYEGEGPS